MSKSKTPGDDIPAAYRLTDASLELFGNKDRIEPMDFARILVGADPIVIDELRAKGIQDKDLIVVEARAKAVRALMPIKNRFENPEMYWEVSYYNKPGNWFEHENQGFSRSCYMCFCMEYGYQFPFQDKYPFEEVFRFYRDDERLTQEGIPERYLLSESAKDKFWERGGIGPMQFAFVLAGFDPAAFVITNDWPDKQPNWGTLDSVPEEVFPYLAAIRRNVQYVSSLRQGFLLKRWINQGSSLDGVLMPVAEVFEFSLAAWQDFCEQEGFPWPLVPAGSVETKAESAAQEFVQKESQQDDVAELPKVSLQRKFKPRIEDKQENWDLYYQAKEELNGRGETNENIALKMLEIAKRKRIPSIKQMETYLGWVKRFNAIERKRKS